jgi:hypothetical protein
LGDWAVACEPKDAVPIARILAKTARRIIRGPPGAGFMVAMPRHCRQMVRPLAVAQRPDWRIGRGTMLSDRRPNR